MTLKSISVSLLCSLLLWADGCAGPTGGELWIIDPVLQPHEDAAELEQLVRRAHDRVNAQRASLNDSADLDTRISCVARRHSAHGPRRGVRHQGFKQRHGHWPFHALPHGGGKFGVQLRHRRSGGAGV